MLGRSSSTPSNARVRSVTAGSPPGPILSQCASQHSIWKWFPSGIGRGPPPLARPPTVSQPLGQRLPRQQLWRRMRELPSLPWQQELQEWALEWGLRLRVDQPVQLAWAPRSRCLLSAIGRHFSGAGCNVGKFKTTTATMETARGWCDDILDFPTRTRHDLAKEPATNFLLASGEIIYVFAAIMAKTLQFCMPGLQMQPPHPTII
mmetsp:Transcript_36683/g.77943  ORF Transcript_36683/g.77943 Transcript_36683/m.77943 type:complete len:205 (-) Transcript_36683:9-623(-)